jgi:DNA segregation ATPase FtsK/SpoIIIE-like protein
MTTRSGSTRSRPTTRPARRSSWATRSHPEDGGAATRLLPRDDEWADYALPDLSVLRNGRAAAGNKKTLDQMTRALEHTLHQFGVDATVGGSRAARR